MQIQIIRIKSEVTDDNPLGFVVINLSDFDATKHEPYDDEAAEAVISTGQTGEPIPSVGELLAASKDLQAKKNVVLELEHGLRQRESELAEREAALVEREQANAAEAQRLANLAASQVAGSTGAPNYSTMSKDELQAALTAKGINFPAAANKADLIALLTSA